MKIHLRLTILLVLCTTISTGWAQQKTRLQNNWEFVKGDLGGVWEAVRPQTAGGPETLPLWEKVTLPHCFNMRDAVDPDVNYYQGPGWYRTQLSINNPYPGGRTVLHFEGAGQKSDVYIYTKKVGSHLGGYDEWTVDITDAIEEFKQDPAFQKRFKGKIPLEIRCDDSRDLETIPSQLSDFNVYGGIYRHLNLLYLPAVSVGELHAKTSMSADVKSGYINPIFTFYHPAAGGNISGEIVVKNTVGKIVAKQPIDINLVKTDSATYELSKLTVKNPHLWTVTDPYLYTVEITAKHQGQTFTHAEKVGFRSFLFADKGPFYLNGKRLLLRGTHRHEDHAGVAAAMTDSMMLAEMQMIKDMGANFIRLGHYQQSRRILQLCDSLGILVWEEIPWCRGGLGGDKYKAQARAMLSNMIAQHYNHPSIILWGLGNENDWEGDFQKFDKQKIRTFMSELNNIAHKLDPSRKTTIRRCDFCKDIPDVYSPSIWAGWYRGVYTEYKKTSEEEFNKVPHFFHAEWGGDSHAGRHSENPDKALAAIKAGSGNDERKGDASLIGGAARVSKDGDWSESYICNLFDWHLKEQETMPWLTGSAFWVFKDFSTPIRPDNPVPYMNQKGVVDRDLAKKESYYVFQSYWATKPMVHIYGHSWPVRWGDANELKMVKVYSNADRTELFVNGKSYGIKQRNSQDFPAAGLRWMVPYQEGNNKLRVVAYKGKMIVSDTVSQRYQTAKWSKAAKLVLSKADVVGDIATIQATLYDAKGVQCLDATNWVSFSLAGDGKLIDDLGTPTGSRKVQVYNGHALISVKLNKGKSAIAVSSEGIPTATLSL
ncbi:glycoside hydrolase family 2 protein [Mucilaginibacter terrenus]|uniref:Glycoside hydrolase family 2 protein n=1 Tax=Mucilaginibacter terrenus TaxID=2482727 RepID=A0A3E2NK32_9SPHI|nr:glycoside hydrolase family 2 TIM barrel-domain containing protein [Mucilaginibacter terrenus]RFZ81357.1 glycoside hydrolase family 2 protein [Mucilaginibacter terrenus]